MRETELGIAGAVALATLLTVSGCRNAQDPIRARRAEPATAAAITLPGPTIEFVAEPSHGPAVSFAVEGTLVGLARGQSIELENASGDALTLAKNGPFQFATGLGRKPGAELRVKRRPPGRSCQVKNEDTIPAGGADVVNVTVTCLDR